MRHGSTGSGSPPEPVRPDLVVEDAWRELLDRLVTGLHSAAPTAAASTPPAGAAAASSAGPTPSAGSTLSAGPAPSAGPLRVHVLGSTDTGKTTFCRWLGRSLSEAGLRVAGVDCDPGQSAVGPPATVGMGWEPCGEGQAVTLRFIGHVTPSGHFLQLTTGIVALGRRAATEGADAVLFDASGFMDTGAGREYHTLLVEATVGGGSVAAHAATDVSARPGHLVLLQREDELEPLASAYERRRDVALHRLRPSPAVQPRSRDRRRSYRRSRFRTHFDGAEEWRLELGGLGRTGRVPDLASGPVPSGLLVAVVDRAGQDRGPHVLLGVEERSGAPVLRLHGTPVERSEITAIRFGSLRLERDEWGG